MAGHFVRTCALALAFALMLVGADAVVANAVTLTPVPGSPFAVPKPGAIAYSPDSSKLAVTSLTPGDTADGVVMFTVGGNGALSTVAGSPFGTGAAPQDVAFAPNGQLLATANFDGVNVSMFAVAGSGALTGVAGSPFAVGGPDAFWAAFSPSGQLLAVTDAQSNTVSIFTVNASGALSAVGSPVPTGPDPLGLAFNPNGTLLAIANHGASSVSVFAVAASGALTQVPGSPFPAGSGPYSLAFSPDGTLLAVTNSNSNTITMLSVAASGALSPVGAPVATGAFPVSATFSPDGTLLADANAQDGTISLFTVSASGGLTPAAGSPISTGPAGSGGSGVAFSPDGRFLAASNLTENDVSEYDLKPAFPSPTVSIVTPGDGASYAQYQTVDADYSCADPSPGPGLASCTGDVPDGSPIDTSTPGSHSFTVTATDMASDTASSTHHYTIEPCTVTIPLPSLLVPAPLSFVLQLGQPVIICLVPLR